MSYRGYRKPESDRHESRLTIYLTSDEIARIREAADLAGMTVSAFVRGAALGTQVRAKPTRARSALIRELSAVGNNLNQLARRANAGRMPVEAEIRRSLDEVLAVIRRLLE